MHIIYDWGSKLMYETYTQLKIYIQIRKAYKIIFYAVVCLYSLNWKWSKNTLSDLRRRKA